jgi:lipoyl(octanoyl) transferase
LVVNGITELDRSPDQNSSVMLSQPTDNAHPHSFSDEFANRNRQSETVATPRGAELSRRTVEIMTLHVIHAGVVPYQQAWDRQRELHAARVAGTGQDTVLLLEHPPVYTAGKRTYPHERPVDGTPVIEVDRGGKITWHGPGQLVGYPIVALPDPIDVLAYVRRMEEVLIQTCATFGLSTVQIDGRTGVWVPADHRGRDRKVAAIGVRVSRGVTLHGFAINCNPDLSWFDRIVPCGISDADVTSLSRELGRTITVDEVTGVVEPLLENLVSQHSVGSAA